MSSRFVLFFGLNWLTSSSIKRESCITFYQVITWGQWQLALQEERQKRKVKQSLVINLRSSRKADRPLETLTHWMMGFFLFVREFENRKKLHVKKRNEILKFKRPRFRDPFSTRPTPVISSTNAIKPAFYLFV